MDKSAEKDTNWGTHCAATVNAVTALVAQSWVGADGSAKRLQGLMQAGYGVFYGDGSDCNFAAHVLLVERQSVSRGELWGVLHALLQCKPGE